MISQSLLLSSPALGINLHVIVSLSTKNQKHTTQDSSYTEDNTILKRCTIINTDSEYNTATKHTALPQPKEISWSHKKGPSLPLLYTLVTTPTCTDIRGVALICIGNDDKVDNARSEVKHNMGFLPLHDGDGVTIAIAGPWHPSRKHHEAITAPSKHCISLKPVLSNVLLLHCPVRTLVRFLCMWLFTHRIDCHIPVSGNSVDQ